MAILVPQKAGEVCDEIFEEFHIPSMIVDANDISVNILGKCNMLKDISDEDLAAYIMDNPAGQDDEMTPFIIIRDITGQKSQPYTPKKPRKQA